MPTISMFYGILVLMTFATTVVTTGHIFVCGIRGRRLPSPLAMVRYSTVSCRRSNSRWFMLGSKSTRRSFLWIGIWQSMAKILFASHPFSKVAHAARYRCGTALF